MEKVLVWDSLYVHINDVSVIVRLSIIEWTVSAVIMLHRYHSFHGRQSMILNLEVEFSYLITRFSVHGRKTEFCKAFISEGIGI
jgi:hypothetical protein